MDERLRALGRAAAHDAEASWARLHALTRTHGRRELFLAIAKLAREGDVAAREALARWSPLVGNDAAVSHGARWTATTQTIEASWLDPMTVLAASDELVVGHRGVGQGWGRLVAIDLRAPERPRWVADTGGMVVWRGDDLLHATPRSGRGATLMVRDAATGEVVSKTDVQRVWSVAVAGDRAVLKTGERAASATFTALDLRPDAFGRTLWTRDAPFATEAYPAGERCLLLEDEALRGYDLETGEPLWELPAVPNDSVLTVDIAGAVLHLADLGTIALDATSGATRWKRGEATAAVGRTRVIVRADGRDVVALDRTDGTEAWRADVREPAVWVLGDHLVAVAMTREAQVGFTLLRADDGLSLNESFVERRGTPALSVLATSNTAVLAASNPGRLTLVRAAPA